ncbi:PepSY domain-containing protein [Streptomyces sp. ATE26]|uniref:PepSY domain-containing protein n=1 Tax=Streptomyces sp. ATE26 TaxID=2954237 RepID=UPI002482B6E4|nr:PepSY domain-containing protein [Streptomyces sp. ATE26]MDI1455963.1 PepSY domain-containing protein [Streptomyces sp. ATE26]
MKRTASIATVLVAAVLVGGSGYSALASGGTDKHGGRAEDRPSATASLAPSPSTSSASLTAAQAAAVARKQYPGTATRVELDDRHPGHWEVHILGADHVRREVRVDIRTGAVVLDRRGGDDRRGDDRGGSVRGDDRQGDDRGGSARGNDRPGDDRRGDDHGGSARGDDRPGDDRRRDDHGGSARADDRAGDDHGVHVGGDDHLKVRDDHGGRRGHGRDRNRGGHGGDDR